MEFIQALLLGLLQGLTEFLPVSSSGHLALAQSLFGMDVSSGVVFEIVVHFGTLCSIMLYYQKEILGLLKALPLWLSPKKAMASPDGSMILWILLSMIPAMVVALFFKDTIEAWFANPVFVSLMLLVTGTILFFTQFQKEGQAVLGPRNAFSIGLAQAFAILPGISRSGSTISMALFLGMNKKDAANFSFLMVIPVIGGAMILAVKDLMEGGEASTQLLPLLIGFLASFGSGYVALKFLINLLRTKGIHAFAWYCWGVGLLSLAWLLI